MPCTCIMEPGGGGGVWFHLVIHLAHFSAVAQVTVDHIQHEVQRGLSKGSIFSIFGHFGRFRKAVFLIIFGHLGRFRRAVLCLN